MVDPILLQHPREPIHEPVLVQSKPPEVDLETPLEHPRAAPPVLALRFALGVVAVRGHARGAPPGEQGRRGCGVEEVDGVAAGEHVALAWGEERGEEGDGGG